MKHDGRIWLKYGHDKPWRSWRRRPTPFTMERAAQLDQAIAHPKPRKMAAHICHSERVGRAAGSCSAGSRALFDLRTLIGAARDAEVPLSASEVAPRPPAIYEHADLESLSLFARQGWFDVILCPCVRCAWHAHVQARAHMQLRMCDHIE